MSVLIYVVVGDYKDGSFMSRSKLVYSLLEVGAIVYYVFLELGYNL